MQHCLPLAAFLQSTFKSLPFGVVSPTPVELASEEVGVAINAFRGTGTFGFSNSGLLPSKCWSVVEDCKDKALLTFSSFSFVSLNRSSSLFLLSVGDACSLASDIVLTM